MWKTLWIAALGVSLSACAQTLSRDDGHNDNDDEVVARQVSEREIAISERASCPEQTPTGAAACGVDFGALDRWQTFSDVQRFLQGTWRLCSERVDLDIAGTLRPKLNAHAGIEFSGDSYSLLFDAGDGTLAPKPGLDYQGSFHIGLNGVSSVIFMRDDGGEPQALLVASACPRKVRMTYLAGPTEIREYSADDERRDQY